MKSKIYVPFLFQIMYTQKFKKIFYIKRNFDWNIFHELKIETYFILTSRWKFDIYSNARIFSKLILYRIIYQVSNKKLDLEKDIKSYNHFSVIFIINTTTRAQKLYWSNFLLFAKSMKFPVVAQNALYLINAATLISLTRIEVVYQLSMHCLYK